MLDDVLEEGLQAVFCGTAVGTKSANVGAYYAGPGNKFWPTMHLIGLTGRLLAPDEFRLLASFGFGLTDIVKCRAGNDAVLARNDFDVPGFRKKIMTYTPKLVAFNGKKAAAVFFDCHTGDISYGLQNRKVGQSAIFVLPSTSGSANGFWNVEFWRELAKIVRQ